jgi:hypothetical protein
MMSDFTARKWENPSESETMLSGTARKLAYFQVVMM